MTPQQRFERAQDDTMPRESLAAFRGQWVVLRDGLVVAANIDAVLLYNDDPVRAGDVLVAVPFVDDTDLVV